MDEDYIELISYYLKRIELVKEQLADCQVLCRELEKLAESCTGRSFTALSDKAKELDQIFSLADTDCQKAALSLNGINLVS